MSGYTRTPITMSQATDRNTKCYTIDFYAMTLCFSYETCVAFHSRNGGLRTPDSFSRTTGRHLNETGWKRLSTAETHAEFEARLSEEVANEMRVQTEGDARAQLDGLTEDMAEMHKLLDSLITHTVGCDTKAMRNLRKFALDAVTKVGEPQ